VGRFTVRHPDDRLDPVELLVDITFVLLLSRAGALMLPDPHPGGVLRALAVMVVSVMLWQSGAGATGDVAMNAPMRLLCFGQVGGFAVMAVWAHEVYSPSHSWSAGPMMFAAGCTLAGGCAAGMWVCFWHIYPSFHRSALLLMGHNAVLVILVWIGVLHGGQAEVWWLLAGYAVSMTLATLCCVPLPPSWGTGSGVEGFEELGTRAWTERYEAAFIAACALSLELLELAGQTAWSGGRLLPAMLALTLTAVAVALVMFGLYEPLPGPAREVMDPRNAAVGKRHKGLLMITIVGAHMLMFFGLVMVAEALRNGYLELASLTGPVSRLGPPAGLPMLVGLYGGAALCLAGQAVYATASTSRLDKRRLAGAVAIAAVIPVAVHRPVLIPVCALPVACGAVLLAVRRRSVGASLAGRFGGTRLGAGLGARLAGPAGGITEATAFELLFDVMAAFGLSQAANHVLDDPTPKSAACAAAVLILVYDCWVCYCYAANNARADQGALRFIHSAALGGLILLGLALPRAFTGHGLTSHTAVFIAGYLVLRAGTGIALAVLTSRARADALATAGYAIAAAVALAAAASARPAAATGLWLLAAALDRIATRVYTKAIQPTSPAHLNSRFGLLVIIGLDMSLGGVCLRLTATPTPAQLALICLAVVGAILMWWLYFDTLTRHAEHSLVSGMEAPGHRHIRRTHRHYVTWHLPALGGMTMYAFGLRACALALTTRHPGLFGPHPSHLVAYALALGMGSYLVSITAMWINLGKRPGPIPWTTAAVTLAAAPVIARTPVLPDIALLTVVAVVPTIVHHSMSDAHTRISSVTETPEAELIRM
jgi:low temperature requirement protein LtrA